MHSAKTLWRIHLIKSSGVGVRLKVGDKYSEEWSGGAWGRAVPSPVVGLGLAPRKKKQFCAKSYAILSKLWYFFPKLQHKVGGIIPSPKSGDLYPPVPPPCSDAYDKITQLHHRKGVRTLRQQDTSAVGHFGSTADVSYGHFGSKSLI